MRLYQANVWAATAMNWHKPCCSFALDCSMLPSYFGRFRKMPPVQLKNLPPATHMLRVIPLPPPPVYSWLRTVKYNTFSDTLIFSYWEVVLFSYLKSWNGYAPLPPSPSSLRLFSHISQCKPTPALLASSNWGKHYSRALYRQQFCWVIIVYVGCILGDWRISNKEFVTHFAEWTLWCPPCWILCLSSTSS